MSKKIAIANWKMNKSIEETKQFFKEFIPLAEKTSNCTIGIAPMAIGLYLSQQILQIQRKYNYLPKTATILTREPYTGELSPRFLKKWEYTTSL